MQTSMEQLGRLERRFDIAVPQEQVDREVETRLKSLSRTVKLHGFRPGKVPLKLVAQQYGGQVRREVLEETLQKNFGDLVRERNLRIAGSPRFEEKPAAQSAQYEYSVTFEVYPEVAVGDLSAATVRRPVLTVGDAEVDKTIEILRRQRATFEETQRTAAPGDRVTIDFHGTLDGAEFQGGSAADYQVTLGDGSLLKDFESQIAGMRAGDARTFELTFPADYHGKSLAGKTVVFNLTVKRVAEAKLPQLDAEFARSLGVASGDLAQMRSEVKANVEGEVRRRLKAKLKNEVLQALLDVTKPDLPSALVASEVRRLMEAAHQEMKERGGQAALTPGMFEAQARYRVGLGLIIAELAKQHDLRVKPEQVRSVIEEHAQSYENPEEVVRWYYAAPDRMYEVESMVLEDNVVEWVLARCRVEEQAADFDELMGNA